MKIFTTAANKMKKKKLYANSLRYIHYLANNAAYPIIKVPIENLNDPYVKISVDDLQNIIVTLRHIEKISNI